jgi:hypothetical protein
MAAAVETLISGAVFPASIVAWVSYVAHPIAPLVGVEVIERLRTALRQRSHVAMMRIIAIIHMAIPTMSPMEPRARSDEHPASEPIRPIVAIRSTVIRRIIKVPIGAHRRRSNTDGNLGRYHGYTTHQRNRENRVSKPLPSGHKFLLNLPTN